MEFVYMKQENAEEGHWFPNEEGVVTHQEARGWVVVDPPEEVPFVPQHGDVPPEQKWVTLHHPLVKANHDFPNNPAALEGAYESGWRFPEELKIEAEEAEVKAAEEESLADEAQPKKTAKKTTSAKSATDTEKVN